MILKMNISATFVVAYIQANSLIVVIVHVLVFVFVLFKVGGVVFSHSHSNAQAMEVFPTSVRQSGIGFCSFISQMISIGGPYAMAAGAVNVMVC